MRFLATLLFGVALGAPFAQAQEYGRGSKHFYIGADAFLHNAFGEASTSPTGEKGKFGTLYPALFASLRIGGGSWQIIPGVLYTPLGKSDADGGSTRKLYAGSVAASRRFGIFDLRLGSGLLFYSIRGKGGTIDLDNGSAGSTTTFYHPDASSTSRNFFGSLGLGFELGRWRLDLDAWMSAPLTSRRATSGIVGVSYGVF
jgi:hypothetical protein